MVVAERRRKLACGPAYARSSTAIPCREPRSFTNLQSQANCVKYQQREFRTSGSVRGGDGDIPTSARRRDHACVASLFDAEKLFRRPWPSQFRSQKPPAQPLKPGVTVDRTSFEPRQMRGGTRRSRLQREPAGGSAIPGPVIAGRRPRAGQLVRPRPGSITGIGPPVAEGLNATPHCAPAKTTRLNARAGHHLVRPSCSPHLQNCEGEQIASGRFRNKVQEMDA